MTPQQHKLYDWLLLRVDEPVGPTFEEMRKAMGFKAKSGIHRLLGALAEQGKITRIPNRDRSVRAVRPNPCRGISTAALIHELRCRGEWPDVR